MTKMARCLTSIILALLSFPLYADDNSFLLNKISLQLQAEQWVTTQTALVHVSVNASVATQGIEKVQNTVMQQLTGLADKSEWHIVSLHRQQEKSGLESVQILAEARLPQTSLTSLRDKVKAISNPGVTYTIDNIQFTPSDDEIRQANVLLRNDIYTQAKAEVDTLNKLYPEQKYYLHSVDFMGTPAPMPVAANFMKADTMSARAAPLAVGNKQELTAMIVISSLADTARKGLAPPLI